MIKLLEFKNFCDERGSLVSIESSKNIPFDVKRVYYLFKNSSNTTRGKHAHKELRQVYIAVSGSCKIVVKNGQQEQTIILDRPDIGLFFDDTVVWRELSDFSENCVLMVLADDFYKEEDYIRNYDEFLEYKKLNKN